MNDLRPLLRAAGLRIIAGRAATALVVTLTISVAALALLLAAQKLFAFPIDWGVAWIAAAGAALGAAAVWTWLARPDALAIARAVDDRAQTREVLSTAVCVADRADAWSRAAVEHARAASRRIVLRDAFPARAPRRWPAPLIAAAIYGAIWPLPQGDVMGLLAKAQAEEQQQQELVEAKAQVEAIESEIEKALSQIEDGDLREELEGAETPEPRNAEDVRRQAMKRLTSLKDRLEEMNRGAKNEQLEAMRRQMEKLRQPGPGPLNEMVQSLQQGDFQSARENLEKLMEQMQNGDLSEEQKSRLEAQMKELAQQLEKIAEDRKSLEDELQKNGLDPELAADPEALKEALEQMKNLTDEQKKALIEKAEAMAQACKNCQGMGAAMAKAAAAMGGGQAMGGMGEMAGMLDQMEMLQQEMNAAKGAMQAIQGSIASLGECMGDGMWAQQSVLQKGPGQNNAGQGQGRPGAIAEADYESSPEKANTKTQAGPIIGSRLVQEGGLVRGESQAEFTEAVAGGASAMAEAIENNAIPREHHDAVKRYFGRLESRVKKERLEDAAPEQQGEQSPQDQ